MRHGRAKQARKTLEFFHRTIGLKPSYQVLLDGTFVVAFTQHNLPLQERMDRLLHVQNNQQQRLVFCTTESVLQEVQTLAEKANDNDKKAIFQAARTWMVQNCSILKDIPTASLDWATSSSRRGSDNYVAQLSEAGRQLLTVLTHANGIGQVSGEHAHASTAAETRSTPAPLLIASQDEALLHLARTSGRVPVIRLARGSVLLLEQPSHVAQTTQQHSERRKWRASVAPPEKALVDLVKQKEQQGQGHVTTAAPPPHQRRKRKAKGPNPLSCKKKKDDKPKSKKQKS